MQFKMSIPCLIGIFVTLRYCMRTRLNFFYTKKYISTIQYSSVTGEALTHFHSVLLFKMKMLLSTNYNYIAQPAYQEYQFDKSAICLVKLIFLSLNNLCTNNPYTIIVVFVLSQPILIRQCSFLYSNINSLCLIISKAEQTRHHFV